MGTVSYLVEVRILKQFNLEDVDFFVLKRNDAETKCYPCHTSKSYKLSYETEYLVDQLYV